LGIFQPGCSSQTFTNSAYNCQGNGNKRINWEDMNNSPAYDSHENFLAWAHLSFAEIIEGFYSGNNDSGGANVMRARLNIPASAFGTGGWVFNSDTRWKDDLGISIEVKNQLIVGAHVEGERSYGSLFTPSQAQSIDEKLDDGKPFTGKVIGLVGFSGGASYDSNCSDGAGGVDEEYLLTETNSRCALAIHLSLLDVAY
jgi:hypothetical protein